MAFWPVSEITMMKKQQSKEDCNESSVDGECIPTEETTTSSDI